jgi:hypothetical protein
MCACSACALDWRFVCAAWPRVRQSLVLGPLAGTTDAVRSGRVYIRIFWVPAGLDTRGLFATVAWPPGSP